MHKLPARVLLATLALLGLLLSPRATPGAAATPPAAPTVSASSVSTLVQNYRSVGQVIDFVLNGDVAYVAESNGLSVLDLREPATPRLLTNIPLSPFRPNVMTLEQIGNRLYVKYVSGSAGSYLDIFDLANPRTPTLYATVPPIADVAPLDEYLINVTANALNVIDLTSPLSPTVRASVPISATESITLDGRFALVGRFAYLTATSSNLSPYTTTLQVVDLTDPLSLTLRTTLPISSASSFFFGGTTAYFRDASAPTVPRLQVLDLSDPASPRRRGSVGIGDIDARLLGVADNLAFIAQQSSVALVDLSDPDSPRQRGTITSSSVAQEVRVVDTRAYVVSAGRLEIYDIANPDAPVQLGQTSLSGPCKGLALNDGRAFTKCDGYVLLFDISNPRNPAPLTSIGGNVDAVEVAAGRAFTIGSGGLQALDVSDPDRLRTLAAQRPEFVASSLAVEGTQAYLGYGYGSFSIVDISNPASPRRVFSTNKESNSYNNQFRYDIDDAAGGIVASTSFGCQNGGGEDGPQCFTSLKLMDASGALTPTQRSAYDSDVGYAFKDAQIVGQRVFALGSGEKLYAFDITSSPTLVPQLVSPGPFSDAVVVGTRAYGISRSGLTVLDVSKPLSATLVYSTTAFTGDTIEVQGDLAYVLRPGRLDVLRLGEPLSPKLEASTMLEPLWWSIKCGGARGAGKQILLACGDDGLFGFRLKSATSAALPPTGGVVQTLDDGVTYTVAPGSFGGPTTLKHTLLAGNETPPLGDQRLVGVAFRLDLTNANGFGVNSTQPLSISVPLSATVDGPPLALHRWAGAAWVKVPSSVLAPDGRTINAQIQQGDTYAVLGDAPRTMLFFIRVQREQSPAR